jgi:hypothetical protein
VSFNALIQFYTFVPAHFVGGSLVHPERYS